MNKFNEYEEQVKASTDIELADAKSYYQGVIENIKSVAGQFDSVDDEYFKYTTIVGIINKELKERA